MKGVSLDRFTTIIIFFTVLLYPLAKMTTIDSFTLLSRLLITILITMIFLWLIFFVTFNKRQLLLITPFIIFEVIYILNIGNTFNIDTLFIIIHHLLILMLVIFLINIKWTAGQAKIFSAIYFIVFPFLILYSILNNGLVNSNTIGGYTYLLAFFPLLYLVGYNKNKRYIFVILIMSISVIYLSGTRSIMLAVGFGILTYILWKVITQNRLLFYGYFIVMLMIIFLITVVYPNINKFGKFIELNDLSIKYTGKSLLSGRNQIWELLLDFIAQEPLFGYGSGTIPNNLLQTTLTSHNLYIQIALQVGLIGLLFLLLFLFAIWKTFWEERNNPMIILVSCYFIGIIIYQVFEVTLTQNNFGFMILQWIILGIGLSYCYDKINSRKKGLKSSAKVDSVNT
ncbi:hypothetical protein J14TS2_00930 [Bacillus sp. J14TS2]|uniref:O-antigen ligase family protein n=1 Tax=Bacillus sp. J14TS2 TaxID=2807188 RepID=UPI001B16A67B|nr:O-antigen ligase family protein [Bacillus sp. J14TS2]GIN69618.1 hypothetical protein J14TS2_00930 [Bacillus sp. J14TS2]